MRKIVILLIAVLAFVSVADASVFSLMGEKLTFDCPVDQDDAVRAVDWYMSGYISQDTAVQVVSAYMAGTCV